MKAFRKKMKEYDVADIVFIEHAWGQNAELLYDRVIEAWNKLPVGKKIVITSHKNLGIKSVLALLRKNNMPCAIVGKGTDGLRLIECEKQDENALEPISIQKTAEFKFRGRNYAVNVGSTLFSKAGLDVGTRVLLEALFAWNIDFDGRKVADFGSGWGAISLVIAREFPKVEMVAYEKDASAFEAARENLSGYNNVRLEKNDLAQSIEPSRKPFDYVLSNPPFHITAEVRQKIFYHASVILKERGEMIFVVEHSFSKRFAATATSLFKLLEEKKDAKYCVLRYQKVA